ncbi:hypothetical protein [Caulobacter sp. NIBR2454]|uniref:hypothetical protein n=1 Tax=Caulobacter sp. NIBR2454 TaxID=3015996 RepID=UPI0022B5FFF6|nr:hypothetical protein [Caulobacter sp. NIBR2454]
MATIGELEDIYALINRKAPSAAQSLILQEMAVRSQNGIITDDAAYKYIFDQAAGTTSVATLTYQFFTGKTPTEAGLDYLVNSTTNANDLNDAAYQGFNTENRYINFAVNLGVAGEGRAGFSQIYSPLTFAETVVVAYNRIIGDSQAAEAGIDVNAAVANIAGRKAYFDSVVAQAGITAADRDLAAKAAVVGYIMAEAVKAAVGAYPSGLKAYYEYLFADEFSTHSVDLEGFTPIAAPPGNTLVLVQDKSYGQGALGAADVFTTRADNATGDIAANGADVTVDAGNGFDGISATLTAAGAHTVSLDMGGGIDLALIQFTEGGKSIHLDGGDGRDTLNLTLSSDVTSAVTQVEGFETVGLRTTGGVTRTVDFDAFTGVTRVNASANGGALKITDLTEAVAVEVRSTGTWDTALVYDDVDAATVTLATSNTSELIVEGVETLTVVLTRAVTLQSIFAEDATSTLVVKGDFSARLGDVVLTGDERLVDLTAVTKKDLALRYTTGAEDTDTLRLGGGDDTLRLVVGDGKGDAVVTLGAGYDTLEFDNFAGDSNISFNATGGDLKTVTGVTDFDLDDDTLVVVDGDYLAMAPGAFTGGSGATDKARFDTAAAALNTGFVADRFTMFDAADGSGVYVYSSGDNAGAGDDVYIKLVGISLDDLTVDADGASIYGAG